MVAVSGAFVKNVEELRSLFQHRESTVIDLLGLIESALAAVEPRGLIWSKVAIKGDELNVNNVFSLSLKGFKKIWVISVGKAATGMALGILDVLGKLVNRCIVIAPSWSDASAVKQNAEVYLASHPIPDETGLRASNILIEELAKTSHETLIIFLLSGGSSALLPAPAEGISLEDKAEITEKLMNAGATIEELNIVRKHISSIKGGQLVKLTRPARVLTLILSDVPGDRLDLVGSGPTVPDPTTYKDAYEVLVYRNVWQDAPASVKKRIEAGMAGIVEETPKPWDPVFEKVTNILIGCVGDSCEAAAQTAKTKGYETTILTRSFVGEAASLGFFTGSIALELEKKPGTLYILGGESTVKVKGGGKGGRNQELALAALTRLKTDCRSIVASVGTDGIDGVTDVAGAVACAEQVKTIQSLDLKPQHYLDRNDSYSFFRQVGGHIVTGPTGTNVGDIVLILSPKSV